MFRASLCFWKVGNSVVQIARSVLMKGSTCCWVHAQPPLLAITGHCMSLWVIKGSRSVYFVSACLPYGGCSPCGHWCKHKDLHNFSPLPQVHPPVFFPDLLLSDQLWQQGGGGCHTLLNNQNSEQGLTHYHKEGTKPLMGSVPMTQLPFTQAPQLTLGITFQLEIWKGQTSKLYVLYGELGL